MLLSAKRTAPSKKRDELGSGKNLWRVLLEAKGNWKLVLLCIICVIIASVATLSKPYILEIVLDNFFYNDMPQHGLFSVWGFGLIYLAMIVVAGVLTYAQTTLINRIGQEAIMNLRRKVFAYIQHMPLKDLDRISAGRLITRATNDVEALSELFTDVIVNFVKDVFVIVGIVVIIISLSPKLALISCFGIPLIALVTVIMRGAQRRNFIKIKRLIGQINGFFAENLSGMRIVQLFLRERDKMREFDALNQAYFKQNIIQNSLHAVMRPIMEVINSLVISALIWFAFNDIVSAVILPGVLYAFIDYVKQFFQPIDDLAEMYTNIQSAVVSSNRIYELIDNVNAQEDIEQGEEVARFKGRIEFEHVWFAYNDENWVLKDVSFVVEPGQRIAFVGRTGSGKTTIISLLTRFYEIQKGRILIDGIDISTMKLSQLRRNIAVVLQDVFLFAGDIRDNIALDDDIDDDALNFAMKLSHTEEFVESLDGGLAHEVVERGMEFSSGQRQLISFARAIAHNPSILVLDEATAHIDTQTERMIQASIDHMAKERTMLIIAHRLSTIRACDMIFVMRSGRIEQRGTHAQLLKQGGYYARLHKAQLEMDEG